MFPKVDPDAWKLVCKGELGNESHWKKKYACIGEVRDILNSLEEAAKEDIDWQELLGGHSYFEGLKQADFPPLYNENAFEQIFSDFLFIMPDEDNDSDFSGQSFTRFRLYLDTDKQEAVIKQFMAFLAHLKSLSIVRQISQGDYKPPLPPTPGDLQIEMVEALAVADDKAAWPNIDCPTKLPRSGKLVVSVGVAGVPSWKHDYFISSNKGRTHWILWILCEDFDSSTKVRLPIAWCNSKGVTKHHASCFLLRAWFFKKRNDWKEGDYKYLRECGVLSSSEIDRLRADVWHEEK